LAAQLMDRLASNRTSVGTLPQAFIIRSLDIKLKHVTCAYPA
jgi:hypothetical protein